MNKDQSPSVKMLRPVHGVAVLAMAVALAACDTAEKRAVGAVGHVQGFAGMVAADEPRAALAGRDTLSAGGSAVDAITAMYFTMAVTMPSTASLGGGGSCIVHDPVGKKTEVMEFPAMPSAAGGGVGIPANPRGFFALHAKYGKLRFESLLVEPERLARSGFPVSRALANDFARGLPVLARDPGLRALFLRPDGGVLREGETLLQPNLAAVISNLRRNTGDFYSGIGARELVKAIQAAGGTVSLEDLRDIRPVWRETLKVKTGNETAHFPPPPTVAGTLAGQLTGALWDRWTDTPAEQRPHLMVEASARVFAERSRWMRPDGGTNADPAELIAKPKLLAMMSDYAADRHTPMTGSIASPTDFPLASTMAAVDAKGMGVACSTTLYGLFGIGRAAPGTGIVLAGVPGPNGPPSLAVMVTVNHNSNEVHFVGAASGGGTAPPALAQTFLIAAADNKPLKEAIASPRVVNPAAPDAAFIENGAYAVDPEPLRQRGHQVSATAMPSRIQALHCPKGHKDSNSCEAATDPRGFGLAVVAGAR